MEHGSRGPFDLFANPTPNSSAAWRNNARLLRRGEHDAARLLRRGETWRRRGGKDHWVQKVGGNYPTSPLTMRVRPFIMIMIA